MGRDNVPRGLDWISAVSCSSLTFLLPSKAMRPITGFSTTVTTRWPPGLADPARPGTGRSRSAPSGRHRSRPDRAPAGTRLEIGADGLDFDAPVALDLIDCTVWAAAGEDTSNSRQRGGDRHREHDQGGQQASPYSHSNIHAQRALVIPMPARTPTNRQIPICCSACSQFCRGGKPDIAVQFHFHSKTLPIGHVIKKPLHDAARCRMSL